jgi:hypothetical protein
MKCTKAQDLYYLSRDGALDDAGGIELARHLALCPSCALFAKEMEASLDAARSLPDLAAPEGFEWNVKRRILQEKSRIMRSRIEAPPFGAKRWASRFALGAAAAAVIVLGGLFALQRVGTFGPHVKEIADESRPGATAVQIPVADEGALGDYAMSGSYTGPRMVSGNIFTVERGTESVRQSPFQFVSGSREDSLARENELLRRRVRSLERQIMLLNSIMDKERKQRINMSLP